LLKGKAKMRALVRGVSKAKSPEMIKGFIKNIKDQKKLLRQAKAALEKAKQKRDEKILNVPNKVTKQRRKAVIQAEKAVVKAQTELAALKLKLKKASATNPAKAGALQSAVKHAEKDVKKAKAKVTKIQFAPAVKEAKSMTKAQKKVLVAEKKSAVKKAETRLKAQLAKMTALTKTIKDTKNPDTLKRLVQKMVGMVEMKNFFEKRLKARKAQLAAVQKAKASSIQKVVGKVEANIVNAKKKKLKLKAKEAKLEEKINTSKNPKVVKKAAAKMKKVAKKIKTEKKRIVRRKARVGKIQKIEKLKPKLKPKKTSKVDAVKRISPGARLKGREVERLKEKKAVAKAKLAAAIANAMNKAVGKENAKIGKAKAIMKAAAREKKKLNRSNKGLKKKTIDTMSRNTLQAIKDAWIAGKYGLVMKHFNFHKKRMAARKRSIAARVQARLQYKTLEPKAGLCTKGNCCLTAYDDTKCKTKRDALCAPVNRKSARNWSKFIAYKAKFHKKVSKVMKPKAYTRKLNFQIKWMPVPAGQQLRLKICGALTPEGGHVCFPSKKGDVALATVFNAPQGKCVRTADFVSVSRDILRPQLRRFMRGKSGKKVAKKQAKKDNKKMKAAKKENKMQKEAKRAVGGVFKGALGGSFGLGESHDSASLDAVEELLDMTAQHLLLKGGSFKLTAVGKVETAAAAAKRKAAMKQKAEKKKAVKVAKKAEATTAQKKKAGKAEEKAAAKAAKKVVAKPAAKAAPKKAKPKA